ncbi:hypothetical protein QF018_000113 [Pseudomonas laurylsulfatiphila]
MPAVGPLVSIPFSLHPDYDRRPRDHTGSADLAVRHRRSRAAIKRSRAMRIARNYRRWGVAPRPENVFCRRNVWRRSVFITYFRYAHDQYRSVKVWNLWERACSRRRFYIQRKCRLSVRLREQARSHMGAIRLLLVQGLINRRHARSNSFLKGISPAYRGQIHERYRSSQRHRHPTLRRHAGRDGQSRHRRRRVWRRSDGQSSGSRTGQAPGVCRGAVRADRDHEQSAGVDGPLRAR